MEPQVFLSPLQGFLMIGTLNTFIILLLSCFWIGMLIPSLLSQSHILVLSFRLCLHVLGEKPGFASFWKAGSFHKSGSMAS